MRTELEVLVEVFNEYPGGLTPNMGVLQGIVKRALKQHREEAEAEVKALNADLDHVLDESPGGDES